jgi:transcriptional regulator with XRE-family HTH domain
VSSPTAVEALTSSPYRVNLRCLDRFRRIRLARRVREMREARGWTEDDLRVFGIPRHTLRAVEYGKTTPSLSTLKRLSDAFGVSTDYLLALETQRQ